MSWEACGKDDCTDVHPCLPCKLAYWRSDGGLRLDPKALPTRRNSKAPTAMLPKNSWERGVPTDSRGMPQLMSGCLEPMGIKEFSEKRHAIEERRRAAANSTPGVPFVPDGQAS